MKSAEQTQTQAKSRPAVDALSRSEPAAAGSTASPHIAKSPFIAVQRAQFASTFGAAIQPKAKNQTGLPDSLKSGVESLSGMSMDSVRVHRNSAQPAQINAHAFAQGTDIHVGPGQEKHLPHEAWHVVQQAQGRVRPTLQMKSGVPVNDDKGLEHEADTMGAKAASAAGSTDSNSAEGPPDDVSQRMKRRDLDSSHQGTIQREKAWSRRKDQDMDGFMTVLDTLVKGLS